MSAEASSAVINNNIFNFAAYQAASPATRQDILSELYASFDSSDVDNALFDEALNGSASFLKDLVASSDIPEAMKERANDYVDDTTASMERSSGGNINVDAEIMKMVTNMIMDMIKELGEEGEEQVEGGKKTKQGGAGGGMNWLALMAKALGAVAGEHLSRAIELAEGIGQIGEMTGEELDNFMGGLGADFSASTAEASEDDPGGVDRADQARAMTQLQAMMQAETQLFKMVFEAASTLTKTVGEGFSTMARKQ